MHALLSRTALVCVVLAPTATLAAMDDLDAILAGKEQLPWVQIRLGIGQTVIPDAYPTTVNMYPAFGGGQIQLVDTVDSDSARSFSYGIVAADLHPIGLVGGAEMVYAQQSLALASRTVNGASDPVPDDAAAPRYQSFGGNALLGLGCALGRSAHIEVLGVLGGGACDIGFVSGGYTDQVSGSGWYWNYGVRGGAYYRIGKFVLGAAVEYMHVEVDVSQGWLDAETSSTTDASGVGYRIELGYHIQ